MNIIRVESTSSSNIRLKELASQEQLEEGTVLLTQEQSAGRGQAGTQWESEPGKNLTFSLILYPQFLAVNQNFLLSKIIALSIKNVLVKWVDDIRIKWPNDIYYQDKKITGILIENEIIEDKLSQSIIGIGMNVNQEDFKSDAPNPVSLKQILGADVDTDLLLEETINEILSQYQNLQERGIEKINRDYFDSLYRNQGYHLFSDKNETFVASIQAVKDNGLLCLLTDQGESRQYAFKEVSYLI